MRWWTAAPRLSCADDAAKDGRGETLTSTCGALAWIPAYIGTTFTDLGRIRSKFDQIRPKLAKLGRRQPTWAKIHASLAEFDQSWPNIGQARESLANLRLNCARVARNRPKFHTKLFLKQLTAFTQ